MRRLILTAFAVFITILTFAQDNSKQNKKPSNWKSGGAIGLYGFQGGSRNWAAGSQKFSLAFGGQLNLWATRNVGKHTWTNMLDMNFAMTNTHNDGVKKLSDKIDIVSKYTYDLTKTFSVGVMFNMRTQIADGFDYTDTPKTRVSGFFAPAYITFAPGFQLKPSSYFSVFMSPVVPHWVVITNRPYSFNYQGGIKPDNTVERSLSEKYGVDPEKKVRFEVGPYISAAFHKDIMKNVNYRSRLDLFSDLTDEEPMHIDVFWNNYFTLKANKWLETSFWFDLIYDDNVRMFGQNKTSPAAQLNSMLGVGVTASF